MMTISELPEGDDDHYYGDGDRHQPRHAHRHQHVHHGPHGHDRQTIKEHLQISIVIIRSKLGLLFSNKLLTSVYIKIYSHTTANIYF